MDGTTAFAFEGGGHQQDFQRLFVAKQIAAIQAQRQREVGVGQLAVWQLVQGLLDGVDAGRVEVREAVLTCSRGDGHGGWPEVCYVCCEGWSV